MQLSKKLDNFVKKIIFLKSKILTIGVFFFYSTSAYPFVSDAKYALLVDYETNQILSEKILEKKFTLHQCQN